MVFQPKQILQNTHQMSIMVQGDSGTNCFSPYHNSDKCKRCKEEEAQPPIEDWWDNFDNDLYEKIKRERQIN